MTTDLFALFPSLTPSPVDPQAKPLFTLSIQASKNHTFSAHHLGYDFHGGRMRILPTEASLILYIDTLPVNTSFFDQFTLLIIAFMTLHAKNTPSKEEPIIVRGEYDDFVQSLSNASYALLSNNKALSLRTTGNHLPFFQAAATPNATPTAAQLPLLRSLLQTVKPPLVPPSMSPAYG